MGSYSDYDYTVEAVLPVSEAQRRINEGGELTVELTKLSGNEDVPYGDVHSLLASQMVSSADYGALVTAMLEYHDDDTLADDLYNAIEAALADYIDREWYRICGVCSNGECDPSKADDRFMR